MVNVTIWNEFRHEKKDEAVRKIYPDGMHKAIGKGIAAGDLNIRYATLDEPGHGLGGDILDTTDVLVWWSHIANGEVDDETVGRIQQRVLEGMGLIALHSGKNSKIFRRMLGTSCTLLWREADERERIWVVEPSHPIAHGLPPHFEVSGAEMYGERFDIPQDGEIIFMSWYEGGNVLRSGVTFRRGHGKLFFFAAGHEGSPVYYDANILKVIGNAVRWAAPAYRGTIASVRTPPLEPIRPAAHGAPDA